jgi:hypothetical protein
MKSFEHTSIVGIRWGKEHHTRHGLHLNKKGKELLMNRMDIKNLFLKIQRIPIVTAWPEGQEGKIQRDILKSEVKGVSKRSKESTIQSNGKQTAPAISKKDQEIQHIRTDGDKTGSTNIEDNQIGPQNEEHQFGNHLNRPQNRRTRRPLSKRWDDFLW